MFRVIFCKTFLTFFYPPPFPVKVRVQFVPFKFYLLIFEFLKKLPSSIKWGPVTPPLLLPLCLYNCELSETVWEYFLQKISPSSEGHSTLIELFLITCFPSVCLSVGPSVRPLTFNIFDPFGQFQLDKAFVCSKQEILIPKKRVLILSKRRELWK